MHEKYSGEIPNKVPKTLVEDFIENMRSSHKLKHSIMVKTHLVYIRINYKSHYIEYRFKKRPFIEMYYDLPSHFVTAYLSTEIVNNFMKSIYD